MPKGYKLHKCSNKDHQACGCYIALKKAPGKKTLPSCKIHGVNADHGAEAALDSFVSAGYVGPILTQFPIHTLPGKGQSKALPGKKRSTGGVGKEQSKGGQYNKRMMKVDMLLCGNDCFAAIEIQGDSHRDCRNEHRDLIKAAAVSQLGDCRLFEIHACLGEYKPRGTRSKCSQSTITHTESVALELVQYLYT